MRKVFIFSFFVSIICALSIPGCGGGGSTSAGIGADALNVVREAPPVDDFPADVIEPTRPGTLPPGLAEKIFVRREREPGHTGTCTIGGDDTVTNHVLEGWTLPLGGITYKVSTGTIPASVSAGFTGALEAGFQTWTTTDPDSIFVNGGTTTIKSSKLDGTNLVAFGRLQRGVIAVTRVWYFTSTGVVAEIDEIFSKAFAWSINSYSGNSTDDCSGAANTMDVQNIHTHEAGHWIGLGHPLPHTETEGLTMHAYSAYRELKRQTLGLGDRLGATEKAAK